MPDDMTSAIPTPKVKGKALPKWVIPVAAVVGVGGALYLKKKKSGEATTPETNTAKESEGLTNQSFIPVTGSSDGGGGLGAVGSGNAALTEAQNTQNSLLAEIFKSQNEQSSAVTKQILEERSATVPVTGGGAPTTQAPTGVVAAPSTTAPVPTAAPPTVTSKPSTPSYTTFKKEMTGPKGAKALCECHKYPDGHDECQHVANGHCVW